MAPYPIPAQEIRLEMKVSNSRFIATLTPVFHVDEAKAFISRVRGEFSDATHNVPAFVVGYGPSVIAHCSDDGEPSGTAGRPVLSVLQGSGLGDTGIVITRYFGGTKLGTGGLVRAYSAAARQVLEAVPRAMRIPVLVVKLTLPYNAYNQVSSLIQLHAGKIMDQSFEIDATLTIAFEMGVYERFQNALQEISAGSLSAKISEHTEAILPFNVRSQAS